MRGHTCPDLLAEPAGLTGFDGPRHATTRTHGTGCTLSSARANGPGFGLPLPTATRRAKAYVAAAIAAAGALTGGSGHGPIKVAGFGRVITIGTNLVQNPVVRWHGYTAAKGVSPVPSFHRCWVSRVL